MEQLLQFVITGITVGMVYALIALCFVLVWKSSGVANLALGQLVLISSWVAYAMLSPDALNLPAYLGLPLVIVFALVMGWVIERIVLRPLIAQPVLSLITVTLGVGFFIEGVVTIIWPQSLAHLPRLFPQEPISIGTATMSYESLWTVIIALILFGLLSLYFKYHRMGVAMRAAADDQLAVGAEQDGVAGGKQRIDVVMAGHDVQRMLGNDTRGDLEHFERYITHEDVKRIAGWLAAGAAQ